MKNTTCNIMVWLTNHVLAGIYTIHFKNYFLNNNMNLDDTWIINKVVNKDCTNSFIPGRYSSLATD